MTPYQPLTAEHVARSPRWLAACRRELAAARLRSENPGIWERQNTDRALATTKAVR